MKADTLCATCRYYWPYPREGTRRIIDGANYPFAMEGGSCRQDNIWLSPTSMVTECGAYKSKLINPKPPNKKANGIQ